MKNINIAIEALEAAKEKCSEFVNAEGYLNPLLQHLNAIKSVEDENDIFDGMSPEEVEYHKKKSKQEEVTKLQEEGAELFRTRKVRHQVGFTEVEPQVDQKVEPVVEPKQAVVETKVQPVVTPKKKTVKKTKAVKVEVPKIVTE